MHKTALMTAMLVFFLVLSVGHATADFSFVVESDDNLTWDLYFIAGNEGNLINFYFMDFKYDTAEIDWVSYTPNYALYPNLPPLGSVQEEEAGYITNVSGAALGTGNGYTASPDEKVYLGSFLFTEVSSVSDGDADFNFWLESTDFGIKIDEQIYAGNDDDWPPLYNIVDEENYAQISPVPVPAAFWLFGTGTIALLGVRCRKK
jgi:hypothetical protein